MKRVLQVAPLDGYPPEVGRWLWALEDVRRITRRAVDGLDVAVLDWRGPDGSENSIGSLLYHVAGVEMGRLFFDVLGRELPDDVQADLPHEGWTDRELTHVGGLTLDEHLGRLDRTRAVFLEQVRDMDLGDFRRVNAPQDEDYDVTLEWVVYHLVEHEAGHAYQMRSLKRRAAKHIVGGRDRLSSRRRQRDARRLIVIGLDASFLVAVIVREHPGGTPRHGTRSSPRSAEATARLASRRRPLPSSPRSSPMPGGSNCPSRWVTRSP